jgi:hypothetical protein
MADQFIAFAVVISHQYQTGNGLKFSYSSVKKRKQRLSTLHMREEIHLFLQRCNKRKTCSSTRADLRGACVQQPGQRREP